MIKDRIVSTMFYCFFILLDKIIAEKEKLNQRRSSDLVSVFYPLVGFQFKENVFLSINSSNMIPGERLDQVVHRGAIQEK